MYISLTTARKQHDCSVATKASALFGAKKHDDLYSIRLSYPTLIQRKCLCSQEHNHNPKPSPISPNIMSSTAAYQLCIMAPAQYQAVMDFQEQHGLPETTESRIVVYNGPALFAGETVDSYGENRMERYRKLLVVL